MFAQIKRFFSLKKSHGIRPVKCKNCGSLELAMEVKISIRTTIKHWHALPDVPVSSYSDWQHVNWDKAYFSCTNCGTPCI